MFWRWGRSREARLRACPASSGGNALADLQRLPRSTPAVINRSPPSVLRYDCPVLTCPVLSPFHVSTRLRYTMGELFPNTGNVVLRDVGCVHFQFIHVNSNFLMFPFCKHHICTSTPLPATLLHH